jgi:hypothetical protein
MTAKSNNHRTGRVRTTEHQVFNARTNEPVAIMIHQRHTQMIVTIRQMVILILVRHANSPTSSAFSRNTSARPSSSSALVVKLINFSPRRLIASANCQMHQISQRQHKRQDETSQYAHTEIATHDINIQIDFGLEFTNFVGSWIGRKVLLAVATAVWHQYQPRSFGLRCLHVPSAQERWESQRLGI